MNSSAGARPIPAGEHTHLDFWLGHWECRWEGGEGTNCIGKILDGRVVYERFDGWSGLKLLGQSWSVFDAAMGKWRQTWVDNEGSYLDLVRGKESDRFVLLLVRLAEEMPFKRMIFQNITDQAFDWHWQASSDRGRSWIDSWYIRYRRIG